MASQHVRTCRTWARQHDTRYLVARLDLWRTHLGATPQCAIECALIRAELIARDCPRWL